jgi:hypothetical protein
MKQIVRKIVREVAETLTDEQEVARMRELLGGLLVNPDNYRSRGDVLKVTAAHKSFAVGQMVIVQHSGPPDSDGEYLCWCLTDDGTIADSYAKARWTEAWPKEPVVRARRKKSQPVSTRRRKLDLTETAS